MNLQLKTGILYIDAAINVPTMNDWTSVTIGAIQNWNLGSITAACIVHGLGSADEPVAVEISASGIVTIAAQSTVTSQHWHYGRSAILIS